MANFLIRDFMTEKIFNDRYMLCENSNKYYAPTYGDRKSYLEYIKRLATTSPPAVFGLHENAQITRSLLETDYFMSTLTDS